MNAASLTANRGFDTFERGGRGHASRAMFDELQIFLEAPGARTYRKVREALLDEVSELVATGQGGSCQLSPANLIELTELASAGEFDSILARVEEMQPVWALSPRVHYLAAIAAEETGEADVAQVERFTFQACLEGILATGDGTADAPYLVTYVSDEYDVLATLGIEPRSQRLTERRGLLCDVLKGVDGEEVWFELTGVLYDPRQRSAEVAILQGLRL
jgi:hypothetical protein